VSRSEHRDTGSSGPGRVRLLEGHLSSNGGPRAQASGPRYLLRPSVEPFVARDGALCFIRPGGTDLVVRHPTPADIEVVHRLRGGATTAEALSDTIPLDVAAVQQKLDDLVTAGLVLVRPAPAGPPLHGEDVERFARQLPYLAELGDETTLQRRLRDSSVVILGCGGIGTWVVAGLACIGVGTIVLVDDDVVALSNLNRQILFTRRDVGAAKVSTAARWLEAFDSAIAVKAVARRVASEDDVPPLIAGADAVVLAADEPPYMIGRWVNTACLDAGIPFMVAGQVPPIVKVGPTYACHDGACFACHETALAEESSAYQDYVDSRRGESATAATVGPASAVAGGLIGMEMMHLLTGQRPATSEFAFIMDMRTLAVRHAPVRRDPKCRRCKHLD
jgi:molybdopterin-synthase adenylyltransferase